MTRRVSLVLALIAWFGAVFWYWGHFVPSLARDTIPPSAGLRYQGCNREGLLLFAATDGASRSTGPLRFRDPLKGQWVREALSTEDRCMDIVLGETEVAAIRRNDGVEIVDLTSQQTLFSRPVRDVPFMVTLSPDGRLAAFIGQSDIEVVDVTRGTVAWTGGPYPAISTVGFQGKNLLHIGYARFGKAVSECRDTRTWEIDQRFVDVPPGLTSNDGRFVLGLSANDSWVLFDLESVGQPWEIPRDLSPFAVSSHAGYGPFVFSHEGSEILGFSARIDGSLRATCWKCQTGEEVGTYILHQGGLRNPRWSHDGHFLISQLDHAGYQIPRWADRFLRKLGISQTGTIGERRTSIVVADASTGRSLGLIESFEKSDDDSPFTGIDLSMEMLDVTPQGVVVYSHDGWARYFDLPPRRNGLWLATWLIGPPAGVWLVSRFRQRRRAARRIHFSPTYSDERAV